MDIMQRPICASYCYSAGHGRSFRPDPFPRQIVYFQVVKSNHSELLSRVSVTSTPAAHLWKVPFKDFLLIVGSVGGRALCRTDMTLDFQRNSPFTYHRFVLTDLRSFPSILVKRIRGTDKERQNRVGD